MNRVPRYPILLPGFEEQRIEIEMGLSWTAFYRLLQNDAPVPKDKVRGRYYITNDVGRREMITLFDQLPYMDILPTVVYGGQHVEYVRPLTQAERICALSPLALLAIGGAIGGLFGAAGWYFNLRYLRTTPEQTTFARIGRSLVVSCFCVLAYLIAATAVRLIWLHHR